MSNRIQAGTYTSSALVSSVISPSGAPSVSAPYSRLHILWRLLPAAMVRARNEAEFLAPAVRSIVPLVDEVVTNRQREHGCDLRSARRSRKQGACCCRSGR
jgi:hypothetical protein